MLFLIRIGFIFRFRIGFIPQNGLLLWLNLILAISLHGSELFPGDVFGQFQYEILSIVEAEIGHFGKVQIYNYLINGTITVLELDVEAKLKIVQIMVLIFEEFLVWVSEGAQHGDQALPVAYLFAHLSVTRFE